MTTESTKERELLDESEELAKYYSHPAMVRCRKFLRETLNVFTQLNLPTISKRKHWKTSAGRKIKET